MEAGQRRTRDHGQHQAEPRVDLRTDLEAHQRAHEHHARDAEVDDPGALGEQLADGGEEQHGAGGDTGRQRQLEVHCRTTRTR